MALNDADWSIAANGNIRSVTGTSTHTVLELHRWLMDKLDNATSSGDDLLDVTNVIIPSVRSTDQIITLNSPYNIDDTAAQRFYNGSISQDGGNTLYSGLQVVGSVNNASTQLQIVQNNALLSNYWGTGINVDAASNILLQMLVKTRTGGSDIDGKRVRVQARELGDTYAYFGVTLGLGVGVAAIFTNADDFNGTAAGTISGWSDINNVSEGYQALDVDNNGSNEFYYSQWDKASRTTNNLYERAKWLTRRGSGSTLYGMNGELFLGITHSFNYDAESSTATSWSQNETLNWGSGATAGTATLLGVNDTGTTGTMYIQLLTGVVPTDNLAITGGTSAKTADVDGTVTARSVNANCFLGNYTGALTGAFGVGVQPTDLSSSDSLRALDDVSRNPPNFVQVAVTGLSSGDIVFSARTKTFSTTATGAHSTGATTLTIGSTLTAGYFSLGRVSVNGVEHVYTGTGANTLTLAAPGLTVALSGGEAVSITQIVNDQYNVAAGNTSGSGVLTIQETIGSDNPADGKVRVWNGTNGYHVYSYTSFSGSNFTLSSTLTQAYTATDDVFVPFIDEASGGASISKTIVYPGSAIAGRHRVYNSSANIVPFEVGFSVGAAGSSTQAIRNSDA